MLTKWILQIIFQLHPSMELGVHWAKLLAYKDFQLQENQMAIRFILRANYFSGSHSKITKKDSLFYWTRICLIDFFFDFLSEGPFNLIFFFEEKSSSILLMFNGFIRIQINVIQFAEIVLHYKVGIDQLFAGYVLVCCSIENTFIAWDRWAGKSRVYFCMCPHFLHDCNWNSIWMGIERRPCQCQLSCWRWLCLWWLWWQCGACGLSSVRLSFPFNICHFNWSQWPFAILIDHIWIGVNIVDLLNHTPNFNDTNPIYFFLTYRYMYTLRIVVGMSFFLTQRNKHWFYLE